MFAKPSMNRSDAAAHAENLMTQDPPPLSTQELQELILLVGDRSKAAGRDVLAFTGARSGAGIVAKIMIADPPERRVLLIAVRRALQQARDQV